MGPKIELRGMTWDHTRGHLPMVATAQRFRETHPDVSIQWDVRSLQAFGDAPVEELARRYDLLIIDHPFIGQAAENGLFLPLDEFLPRKFLEDQARNTVGASHASYQYEGHQWALAIDAAAPVSGWRPDLLEKSGFSVPATWSELLELARHGLVSIPAVAIDSLMHFYMLCVALGGEEQPASVDAGCEALRMLRELLSLCGADCLRRNPIATWEALASSDPVAYCPFAYGYSNYARRGYAEHLLEFGGLVTLNDGTPLRSVLGGAGLAVSVHCMHKETAIEYAEFAASAVCQRTLYFDSGGQPGHRGAWLDAEVNRRANGFFSKTLPVLDAAWLRPRFPGYAEFQEQAAHIVHSYLRSGGSEKQVVQQLNHGTRKACDL
jgi:multiple sugar transport system substrate-binding protein